MNNNQYLYLSSLNSLFHTYDLLHKYIDIIGGSSKGGGGPDLSPPLPTPIRSRACLRLKFLHRISLINWVIFLMKRALQIATKLNPRDIRLFASARKAAVPKAMVTGLHRLRNT